MKRPGRIGKAVLALVTCAVGAIVGLPLLAVSGGLDSSAGLCTPGQLGGPVRDSPTILGPSTLTYAELIAWWDSTGRGPRPPRLAVSAAEVLRMYVAEGDVEGVRGDLALAQAIYETGWFTSTDTSRNNLAGIAHPDGARSGRRFPDPLAGVRAHIQLLKKYVDGNDVGLTRPDVAPDAARRATTWEELAGTWASNPDYWTAISGLYDSMLGHARRQVAGRPSAETDDCGSMGGAATPTPEGTLVTVDGITVDASIADRLEAMLIAAQADGLTLSGSGYRSHARQVELRRAHCGTSRYAIYEMPSSSCSPPTARPGNSMHEQGLAIDFDCDGTLIDSRSNRCFAWLNANAADYGFFNLPSESWHWSVNGR